MTHPAVSQQIQSLEKELNVKLFRRTTRSVKLTEEGKIFLNDARQIVAVSERAKKRFDGAAPRLIETVSLGFYNSPCMFLMSGTLERLRAQRPELHPRLQVIPFQHVYRMLEEGDLDAVVGLKEASAIKISAQYKEITKVPVVCVCSSRHPLAGRKEVSLDDLRRERLALFTPSKTSLSFCAAAEAADRRPAAHGVLFLRLGRSHCRADHGRVWRLDPAGLPRPGYVPDCKDPAAGS